MTITPGPTPALDNIQIGTQTAFITAVTPTAKLGGVQKCEITAEIEGENLPDKRASAGTYNAAPLKRRGTAKLSGWMTYEDAPYWLDNLMGQASPSGGGPYVRDYIGMLGTIPARRILTIVKGQASPVAHVYSLAGAFLKKATFKIESNKPLMYDFEFGGYLVGTQALAALSDRTQTPITAPQGLLYIDAVGGTIGSTAITTTWFSAEISIDTKADSYGGIGTLDAQNYRETPDKWEVKTKYMLELDSVSLALYNANIATTLAQRQMRIKFTTGSSQILQFDLAGSLLSAPSTIGDKDGVSTLEFEQTDLYNTALGNYLKASSTNSTAVMA